VEFVKKFLVWSPEERISAQEAILEPWILKGLPEDIRKQHVSAYRRELNF
jgi:hypothetical protein